MIGQDQEHYNYRLGSFKPLMSQFLLETSWSIPVYGLLGALLSLPWAVGAIRRTGPRPAAYLNLLMTTLALIHGGMALQYFWGQEAQRLVIPWLNTLDLQISLSLEISTVTLGATIFVTGLSFLAQLFALGYMEKDWGLARFYALMGFFEGAMSGIALSDSLFMSYALLEMLTLSTYLLVGFWYAQPLVVTAARDAFLTKRVGDLLLLMGVVAISTLSGQLDFSSLYDWVASVNLTPWAATLIGLALIAGPVGKCAQFPLHVWLDEAMEGPNPASIMRNSVVVACGAYVLIKVQPILALSPIVSDALITIGTLTALGGSLVALAQIDIKRTFSYSTSAYLGIVFITVGINYPTGAVTFLLTHGIAKALLFMGVGSIILTTATQNLTELGGIGSRMPATIAAFFVGSLGMISLLPLGSFWSMLDLMQRFQAVQPWLIVVLLSVNALTALNLARVFGLVFTGPPTLKTRRTPEVLWPMAVPMVILVVLTALLPLLLWQWGVLPAMTPTTGRAAIALVGTSLGGGLVGWMLYGTRQQPVKLAWPQLQTLLTYDFYISHLYHVCIVVPFKWGSKGVDWVDRFVVDGAVNMVSLALILGAEGLKYTIPGRMQLYVLTILIGLAVVAALLMQSWIPSTVI